MGGWPWDWVPVCIGLSVAPRLGEEAVLWGSGVRAGEKFVSREDSGLSFGGGCGEGPRGEGMRTLLELPVDVSRESGAADRRA